MNKSTASLRVRCLYCKRAGHLLSGWPKKSSNFIFITKMVFPKSLKFMNSGSEDGPWTEKLLRGPLLEIHQSTASQPREAGDFILAPGFQDLQHLNRTGDSCGCFSKLALFFQTGEPKGDQAEGLLNFDKPLGGKQRVRLIWVLF